MNYEYWLMSLQSVGIGPARRRLLRRQFGSAQEVFCASASALAAVPKLSGEQADAIIKSKACWDAACDERLAEQGIHLVTEQETAFPARLRTLPNAPDALFYKGSLPKQDVPTAAIVGARMCTNYGKEIAGQYASALARHGVQIVSGLAYGIDGYAHQGALEADGCTYGVLGCGVDVCYPRAHIGMYMQIQKKGGLLSEYLPGTQPLAVHFPQRNRIISGLSDLVLVVEAKERSGSLITADFALEQGREVYAVPGRTCDRNSSGCNRLIAQGAGIAYSSDEVLRALGIAEPASAHGDGAASETNDRMGVMATLSDAEQTVYGCLSIQEKSLDELVNQIRLPVPETLSVLLSLQLKGVAEETRKGRYAKKG